MTDEIISREAVLTKRAKNLVAGLASIPVVILFPANIKKSMKTYPYLFDQSRHLTKYSGCPWKKKKKKKKKKNHKNWFNMISLYILS